MSCTADTFVLDDLTFSSGTLAVPHRENVVTVYAVPEKDVGPGPHMVDGVLVPGRAEP
jgi:hypothetical protein